MKQTLKKTQLQKQTLSLSFSMKNSLQILNMKNNDLLMFIKESAQNNPLLTYDSYQPLETSINENIEEKESLSESLYFQLHMLDLSYDKDIIEYIVESLDEHGFFPYDLLDIQKVLHKSKKDILKSLHIIQQLEPIGVAAKDSIDSICIQLKHQQLFICIDIIHNYSNELLKHDYLSIAKKMNISIDEVQSYIEDIQSCNPFPCSSFHTTKTEPILPDFIIEIDDGQLQLETPPLGHLAIREDIYQNVSQHGEIKTYFKEASFFIDAIDRRNKTLLILMNELLKIQKNYFLFQDELQPCTLAMIAEVSGFHTSTVSRSLSNKYYMFHDELFPVKSLFISETLAGDSKDSIMKAMLSLLKKEDPSSPYPDFEIVNELENKGLYVSRRTISKYRLLLHIPNSKQRKKMSNK